jgi:hypothetical protein
MSPSMTICRPNIGEIPFMSGFLGKKADPAILPEGSRKWIREDKVGCHKRSMQLQIQKSGKGKIES